MPDFRDQYNELTRELGGPAMVSILTGTYLPHVRQRMEGHWDPNENDVQQLRDAIKRRDERDQGSTSHTVTSDFFVEAYAAGLVLFYSSEGLQIVTTRPTSVYDLNDAVLAGAHRIELLLDKASTPPSLGDGETLEIVGFDSDSNEVFAVQLSDDASMHRRIVRVDVS